MQTFRSLQFNITNSTISNKTQNSSKRKCYLSIVSKSKSKAKEPSKQIELAQKIKSESNKKQSARQIWKLICGELNDHESEEEHVAKIEFRPKKRDHYHMKHLKILPQMLMKCDESLAETTAGGVEKSSTLWSRNSPINKLFEF